MILAHTSRGLATWNAPNVYIYVLRVYTYLCSEQFLVGIPFDLGLNTKKKLQTLNVKVKGQRQYGEISLLKDCRTRVRASDWDTLFFILLCSKLFQFYRKFHSYILQVNFMIRKKYFFFHLQKEKKALKSFFLYFLSMQWTRNRFLFFHFAIHLWWTFSYIFYHLYIRYNVIKMHIFQWRKGFKSQIRSHSNYNSAKLVIRLKENIFITSKMYTLFKNFL